MLPPARRAPKGLLTAQPGSWGRDADDDVGLFGPDSVTWRVQADPGMILAGLRALLLQATHPLAMAGLVSNSSFKDDPWGRLERTGEYVASVTYGTTQEAERAGARVRGIHRKARGGVEPETGRAYTVDDPELLRWVHVAEVESFLTTYQRGGGRLTPDEVDDYYAEQQEAARIVGLDPDTVPGNAAEVGEYYEQVRPDLHVSDVARQNVRWASVPPMPRWVEVATPARVAWLGLVGTGFALLPPWARQLYGLPGLEVTDAAATIALRTTRRALLAVPESVRTSPQRREAVERAQRIRDERAGRPERPGER